MPEKLVKTSKMILSQYLTPAKLLHAHRKTMIERSSKTSGKGTDRATSVYDKLTQAATAALTFECLIESVYFNISMTLGLIELLNTIPGVGFLTAVTIMYELGDFTFFNQESVDRRSFL